MEFDTTLVQVNYFIPENVNTQYVALEKYEVSDYHKVSNISEIVSGKVIGDVENIFNWIMGYKSFNQCKYKEAIEYFKKVKTKGNIDYAQINHITGMSYERLGLLKMGIEFYSKAIELDSMYWTFNNRGNCYVNIDSFDLALKDFNKGIELTEGKYPDLFLNRGILHREIGNIEMVHKDFDQAIIAWKEYNRSPKLLSLITSNAVVQLCKEGYFERGFIEIEKALNYDKHQSEYLIYGENNLQYI